MSDSCRQVWKQQYFTAANWRDSSIVSTVSDKCGSSSVLLLQTSVTAAVYYFCRQTWQQQYFTVADKRDSSSILLLQTSVTAAQCWLLQTNGAGGDSLQQLHQLHSHLLRVRILRHHRRAALVAAVQERPVARQVRFPFILFTVLSSLSLFLSQPLPVTALSAFFHSPFPSQPFPVTALSYHSPFPSQPSPITALSRHSAFRSRLFPFTTLSFLSPFLSQPFPFTALFCHSPFLSQPFPFRALSSHSASFHSPFLS